VGTIIEMLGLTPLHFDIPLSTAPQKNTPTTMEFRYELVSIGAAAYNNALAPNPNVVGGSPSTHHESNSLYVPE
jgi:hypothetical protein